ncbi:hypothetical protein [Winogradskyella algicola]|uniref:hypothetical protein n=1 Tax=Winogradskyella algicola TaxID=2575815 RepID=UPI001107FFAF|nr:hypothetical protein [Winogradskyella algicola]
MAVWQYQLNVIPRKAILEKYGEIPNALFIDHVNWEIHWENVKFESGFPEPNFEDAKTIKWWTNAKLDVYEISDQIDKLVSRAGWGKDSLNSMNWKGSSKNKEDNDCFISFDQNTLLIGQFHFRTDLRDLENTTIFMNGMLKICEQNDLMVFNTDGVLFEPKLKLISEDLKKSNAIKFLTDPIEFLEKIGKEHDKKSRFWSKIKSILE